jgi:hypothetical protein
VPGCNARSSHTACQSDWWDLLGPSARFRYDNFLQQRDVDLGWIRHVMRRASLYRLRGESPDPRWVP